MIVLRGLWTCFAGQICRRLPGALANLRKLAVRNSETLLIWNRYMCSNCVHRAKSHRSDWSQAEPSSWDPSRIKSTYHHCPTYALIVDIPQTLIRHLYTQQCTLNASTLILIHNTDFKSVWAHSIFSTTYISRSHSLVPINKYSFYFIFYTNVHLQTARFATTLAPYAQNDVDGWGSRCRCVSSPWYILFYFIYYCTKQCQPRRQPPPRKTLTNDVYGDDDSIRASLPGPAGSLVI